MDYSNAQSETSPPSQSSLPDAWIDRLFGQMAGLYGSKFADLWSGTDIASVKAIWARKLGGFVSQPTALKEALDALDDHPFPPTLPEFLTLCRNAARRTGTEQLRLDHKLSPEDIERNRLMSEKAKQATKAMGDKDPLLWAKQPRSRLAFQAVLDMVQKGDSRFTEILGELQKAGHAEGNHLVRCYDGQQWVRA